MYPFYGDQVLKDAFKVIISLFIGNFFHGDVDFEINNYYILNLQLLLHFVFV